MPRLSVLPSLLVAVGNADPFPYSGNAAYGLGGSALPAFEFVPHVLPDTLGQLRPGAAAATIATPLRSGAGGRTALWASRAFLAGPADPIAGVVDWAHDLGTRRRVGLFPLVDEDGFWRPSGRKALRAEFAEFARSPGCLGKTAPAPAGVRNAQRVEGVRVNRASASALARAGGLSTIS